MVIVKTDLSSNRKGNLIAYMAYGIAIRKIRTLFNLNKVDLFTGLSTSA